MVAMGGLEPPTHYESERIEIQESALIHIFMIYESTYLSCLSDNKTNSISNLPFYHESNEIFGPTADVNSP